MQYAQRVKRPSIRFHTPKRLCLYVCVCPCMYVRVRACACVYMCVHVHACVYIHVCTQIAICRSAALTMSVKSKFAALCGTMSAHAVAARKVQAHRQL
jgi:5-carboxymethyl-2-hydroxymuconate isomerase